ncbi:Inosine-uridine nucleoside N-ribohydrolase [Collimonas sp. OK307]|nr:Inosine-uridine nucleoside N-ribohydrolase [Collimonas sp. OK307]
MILVRLLTFLAALAAMAMAPAHADAPMVPRKVIITQDASGPGGTNMQSILMLLQARDVEVLGIVVSSGDGWRDENAQHTLRLLEIAGRTDVPVYLGAVFPLVNNAAKTLRWEQLYGALTYKGAWTDPTSDPKRHADPYVVPALAEGTPTTKPVTGSGIDFMVKAVHEFPDAVTIWSGGPLTDIALAARLDPAFASLAKELVFMGGSFNPVAADNAFAEEYRHNTRLEFNIRWDPEAASMVLHEPWKRVVQVPVDPTTATFFSAQLLGRLGHVGTPIASYLHQYGIPLPMWDELTAMVWLDPSIIKKSATMLVDVDTSFTAGYGNTLSWPLDKGPHLGERPVQVVQAVDVPRFERLTMELLSRQRPIDVKNGASK